MKGATKMRKKILLLFLTVAMVLSLFAAMPMTASAEEVTYDGEFNIEIGEGTGSGFRYASGELWLDDDGTYLVYGNKNKVNNRIRVSTGVTATVTIRDINLEINLPFECGANSNVTLVLADNSENTFTSYGGHAGLRVVPTATLTITTAGQSLGNGSLSAYGSADSSSHWATAGIGGSELEPSGTIVIDGGTVFAKGGNGRPTGYWTGPGGAGIGGASGRACGDITINGGTITAIGGDVNPEGAGIGGGSSDPSRYEGKIIINGGTVRAYSGQTGTSGTGIGFCSSIAINDTAHVEAYSSGNYPAIYGTTNTIGHSAFLLNFMLDAAVSQDTDITITQPDDNAEIFEMTLLSNYKNFAATVKTTNDYNAGLSDNSKKIVMTSDEDVDFQGVYDAPDTAFSYYSVKLLSLPPLLQTSATSVDGSKVILTFNKVMSNPTGKHEQFSVVSGSGNTVTSAVLGTDTKTIELILTAPIAHGQTVTMSYMPGSVTAADGGILAAITEYEVTNCVEAIDNIAPILTAGIIRRISDAEASVTFISDEAGEYYYAVTEAGVGSPVIDTSTPGTVCDTNEQTIFMDLLTAGAKDIYIVVKDANDNVSDALLMEIPTYMPPLPTEPGIIQFESSGHGTYEGYNGWMIGVSRTGGSDGDVSVSYAMDDGTAKAGTHYQAYSGTLTWADGDSSRKVIMFTANDDSIYSGYLDLSCVLSNPTGGAILGEQNPLSIQISDNDTPPAPTGLKVTAGNGQVSLSWDPVNSAYYKLYYSTIEEEIAEGASIEIYEGENYTINGLKNGTTYYFAIKAGHNIYFSDLSGTVSATPKAPSSSGSSYTPPKYPVTDSNQGTQVGGQIKFSKERTEAGDTVIITVTPDKGYEISKPVVLDSNKDKLAVTDNGDGTFSFKMPSGGVTVKTEFTKIDYFDDVNEDDWFDEASWYCAAHGLMQGTGNRQFNGHMGTNRAMLVTVLYRLANSTDSLNSIFDDVESGKWYSDAIGWAARNKVVEGYGNGKFGPDDDLTREQMVSVLYRYSMYMKYDISELNGLDTFNDANAISEWAKDAMKWAVGNGIVTGMGNDLISPKTGATRAQFAIMIQRYATAFVK